MIREILVSPEHVAWLPWAVGYFFFIGIALSAVIVAVVLRYGLKRGNSRAELLALLVALSGAIVAPIALTGDLHQPSRAWHFYTVLTYWSCMWWGAYFLPVFVGSVAGYFLFVFRQVVPKSALPTWLGILHWGNFDNRKFAAFFSAVALLFAGLILFYTAVEVYNVDTRPLWHQVWLMPLILFSVLPCALLVTQFLLYCDRQAPAKALQHLALLSVIAWAACVLGMLLDSHTEVAFKKLLQLSVLPELAIILALGSLVGYLGNNRVMVGLAALSSLALAWVVRWMLVIHVQTLPKYNALLDAFHLDWSVDGGLGIAAVFGLWITVTIVLWQLCQYRALKGGNNE